MVASDTVVGLVGAGILLLALVGVFVVETRGGPTGSLEAAAFPTTASGNYASTSGTGTQVAPGVCLPNPPATACDPAQSSIDVRVAGLPPLGDGVHYVVFLTGGGESPLAMGTLSRDGQNHTLTSTENQDGTSYTEVVVTVESSQSPSTPSDLVLHRWSVSGGQGDLEDTFTATLGNGTGQARFTQSGGDIRVQATFTDLEPVQGFSFHAWFVAEGDGNATYVGALTVDEDDPTRATLGATAEGARLGDQRRFVVTIESGDGPPDENGLPGFPWLTVDV